MELYDDYENNQIQGFHWDWCPRCGENTVELIDFIIPVLCMRCQQEEQEEMFPYGEWDEEDE